MTNAETVMPRNKPNFENSVEMISKLVKPHVVTELADHGEIEYPGWDGIIKNLKLEPDVAAQADLGQAVRARVIGDYELGIAIIMRSRNLFDTRRHGFFIQPTDNDDGPRDLEIWQAPALKPERGKVYWGIELLDEQQAQQCSPEVSESLLSSLRQAAQ